MLKDQSGNTLKVGDVILYSGLIMVINEINVPNLIGATTPLSKGGVTGMVMPANIVCQITLFHPDPNKPVPTFVLKQPSKTEDTKPN